MLEQLISNTVVSALLIWILLNQKARIDKNESSLASVFEITIKSQNSIISIIEHLQKHDFEIKQMLVQISDNQESIATLLERTKKL